MIILTIKLYYKRNYVSNAHAFSICLLVINESDAISFGGVIHKWTVLRIYYLSSKWRSTYLSIIHLWFMI